MLNTEVEEWRTIKGCDGYIVSNLGRVKSIRRKIIRSDGKSQTFRERILKTPLLNGYAGVTLRGRGNTYVHKIVAEAFLGDCPEGMEVNHIDGNKENAAANNLEYVTHSRNMTHAHEIGIAPKGAKRTQAKLTKKKANRIRRIYATGRYSLLKVAKAFGVSTSLVHKIVENKAWT